jgi:GDP-L-fucose synthase
MTELQFPLTGKRVWVAGHKGMVGAALVRRLARENCEILTVERAELDLRRQEPVEAWMAANRPDAIFLAAAKVGGIMANMTHPAQFLYDNLAIQTNVMRAAHMTGVNKLLFLGSSCIYPRLASQPIDETALLTGPLEPTNEWYAIAKIAGLKLAQAYRQEQGRDFISAMPTNLYGPGDNFDLATSHVPAALIRKAHEAKMRGETDIVLWGTGQPRREFLHVDDCADALVFMMKHYSGAEHLNVGTGEDIAILDFAKAVIEAVGFSGGIRNDLSRPDGAPRKLLSVEKLNALGWNARIGLKEGLSQTYQWFMEHADARGLSPR